MEPRIGRRSSSVRGSTILELEAGKIRREYLQGMLGMHRRWYDGGQYGVAGDHTVWGLTGFRWNQPILWAAWVLALAQIPFIINFFWSIKHGKNANDNPPEATTVEWTAPNPAARTEILRSRSLYIADPSITAFAGRRRIFVRRTRLLLCQP